ncbi:acyl-CoA dehydrogenase family protein [Rhodococcus sp. Eu-32]|uniref:acyl-CoA dehydrogenase family protein n=1 Tax=Rhodococcus sp. Eu-32 TaxID=1017319 RepID=UPI001402FB2C|nr:acyl-CoA dehydrogenase family protein [Rhodococcus sp. Eu-32]
MITDELTMVVDTARTMFESEDRHALVDQLVSAGIEPDDLHVFEQLTGALMTEQGRSVASSTLLSLILCGPLFDSSWSVVLPALGVSTPPGRSTADGIEVDGVAVNPHSFGPFVVHASESAVLVPADAVTVTSADGFDPELGLHRVRGMVSPDRCSVAPVHSWDTARVRALRALSFESIGLAERALNETVAYVKERKQFGRSIGRFQVVQHRLVDAYTALESAKAVVESSADSEDIVSALVAKAWSGKAARKAVDAAQQFSGAIGFTLEFGLHRLVRRVYVIDALFGDSVSAVAEIGDRLVASAVVPRSAAFGSRDGVAVR